jgi:hypothetical protein
MFHTLQGGSAFTVWAIAAWSTPWGWLGKLISYDFIPGITYIP